MFKKILSSMFAAVLSCLCAAAQGVEKADSTAAASLETRVAAAFDWKIVSGLHLEVEEEARFADGPTSFDRLNSMAALSYKVLPFLKLGVGGGYLYYSDGRAKARLTGDVAASFKSGLWSLGIRERFQATRRLYDVNAWQTPQTDQELRTRVKLAYQIAGRPLRPYAAFEARHILNAVNPGSLWEKGTPESDRGPVSYDDAYLNRIRVQAGVDWRIDANNGMDFYCMFDSMDDRDIDASRKGKIKALTDVHATVFTIGMKYSFSLK